MVWIGSNVTPDENAILICIVSDRIYRAFYKEGKFWSADGRLMPIEPSKWIYEKDLIKSSFFNKN